MIESLGKLTGLRKSSLTLTVCQENTKSSLDKDNTPEPQKVFLSIWTEFNLKQDHQICLETGPKPKFCKVRNKTKHQKNQA